jgi:YfiH family protein
MKPVFDSPEIFHQFPGLVAVQSTRLGGVSLPPFDSLNLGLSTEDKKELVDQNRLSFLSVLGLSENDIASSGQVHGNAVLVATETQRAQCYDAVITNKKGLFAAVTVADCTPVLIYDPVNSAVAAIHAGWKGTVQQIAKGTLDKMKSSYGTEPANCFAYIGTCISEKTFEVGPGVADLFTTELKRFDPIINKFFVDLKKANLQQLIQEGVPVKQIEVSRNCTVLNNDRYFSYRKEKGQTGRMLALIGIK